MRVQRVAKFLAVARRGALEPGVGSGEIEVPVRGVQVGVWEGLGGVLRDLDGVLGGEEGAEEEVGCCAGEERVDEQSAFKRSGVAHC